MSGRDRREFTNGTAVVVIEVIGKAGQYQVQSTCKLGSEVHTARGRTFARIHNARRDLAEWSDYQTAYGGWREL